MGVVTKLLSQELRAELISDTRAEYEKVRERLANRKPKSAKLSYAESIEKGFQFDWDSYAPVPKILANEPSLFEGKAEGLAQGHVILDDYDLKNLLDYIDWTPFLSGGIGRQVSKNL